MSEMTSEELYEAELGARESGHRFGTDLYRAFVEGAGARYAKKRRDVNPHDQERPRTSLSPVYMWCAWDGGWKWISSLLARARMAISVERLAS